MNDAVGLEYKDEVAELNSLDGNIDEASAVSLNDAAEQEHNDKVAELHGLESDIEVTEPAHEEANADGHLTVGMGDATTHEHQDEVAEPHSLEDDAEAKEKVSNFQENANGPYKKSHKRRARKNKSNGSKSEEASVDQISISISDETNVLLDMDQISDPVDHEIILVDQNKDE